MCKVVDSKGKCCAINGHNVQSRTKNVTELSKQQILTTLHINLVLKVKRPITVAGILWKCNRDVNSINYRTTTVSLAGSVHCQDLIKTLRQLRSFGYRWISFNTVSTMFPVHISRTTNPLQMEFSSWTSNPVMVKLAQKMSLQQVPADFLLYHSAWALWERLGLILRFWVEPTFSALFSDYALLTPVVNTCPSSTSLAPPEEKGQQNETLWKKGLS